MCDDLRISGDIRMEFYHKSSSVNKHFVLIFLFFYNFNSVDKNVFVLSEHILRERKHDTMET